ncbi:MAG: glycosyltransferase [Planctomycetota bacterium]
MRVLQIVPSYLPAWRYGGPVRSVHGLATGLVRLGHDVRVLTTDRDDGAVLDVPTGRDVELDGARVRYLEVRGPERLRRAPALAATLRELAGEVDVVHVHGLFNAFGAAACRTARRIGLPYVVSPRGMLMRDALRLRGAGRKRAWLALFERKNLEAAAAIHVTARNEWDELDEVAGVRWPRRVLVPNAVERAVHDGSTDGLSDEVREVVGGAPFALFLGRVNRKKGLDRLARALAVADRRVRVVVAGPDDGFLAELLALRSQLGLEDRLRVLGAVSGRDRAALVDRAHLAVLASYSENFGNAPAESLAVGRPALVTPEVGMAELVERYDAGAVVAGEPKVFGAALSRLFTDDVAYERARLGAEIAAEEALDPLNGARSMAELYAAITGRAAASRAAA